MTYLFRASFSPVQSFIAQSRKLQDLYAGSYVLSYLAKMIIKAAEDNGAEILYPKYEIKRTTYPNLFMAKVPADNTKQLQEFAQQIEQALHREWRKIGEKVMDSWGLKPNKEFNAQIDHLWQFFWSAEEYKSGAEYRSTFLKTLQKMGAAKTTRLFNQLEQESGRKCDINPEYNALFCRKRKGHMNPETTYELDFHTYDYKPDRDDDSLDNKYIKQNEVLSGVAFIKRSLKKALPEFDDNFPDIASIAGDHKYYALLQFDGDNMGTMYSTENLPAEKLEEFQVTLSKLVSESSEHMTRIVAAQKNNGIVIYAGGDDFLGVFNLDTALSILEALRNDFQTTIKIDDYLSNHTVTLSAGIVVAHIKTPLSEVLRWAHESEEKAKVYNNTQKDAYCLTILKHSGEISQYCHSFTLGDENGISVLQGLIDTVVKKDVSTSFIYQLMGEFERIISDNWREMVLIEARRLLARSDTPHNDAGHILGFLNTLINKGGDSKEDFLNLLGSVAFIARQRGGAR